MTTPEQMRAAVAQYVEEIHRAYVAQAMTFPAAVRGRMPLLAPGPLTVAAVGARNLHVLATRDSLGPVRSPEVELSGSVEGLSWTLRFFDSVVLPELAALHGIEQSHYHHLDVHDHTMLVLAETIALAEALGIDPQDFFEAVEGGPLDLPYARIKGKAMIERSFEDPAFRLALARKDAELILEAAGRQELELPIMQAVTDRLRRAERAGHGEEDMAATYWVSAAGNGAR